MTDDMLVRIRGEVAQRIRQEHAATGAPFTAIVDRRLREVFEYIDGLRGVPVKQGRTDTRPEFPIQEN